MINKVKPPNFLVLVNPISGGGSGAKIAPLLPDIFKNHGLTAEVFLMTGPGSAGEIIRDCAANFSGLVAVGGDGTINEVASAVFKTGCRKPVGIIPLGLSNCLARHLNLPRTLDGAVATLARGARRTVDAASFGEGLAVAFIGAGLDAAMVRRVAMGRRGPVSNWIYIKAGLAAWRKEPWPEIEAEVDGRRLKGGYYLAILCAITNYAAFFNIPPGEGYRLYLFRGRGMTGLLRSALGLGSGLNLTAAADLIVPVRESLAFFSPAGAGHFQYDGEYGGPLPVNCRIHPAALSFFTGARSS
ncbi:MAG: hypothetical protein HQK55_10950 [Deltaproteobacteria bacterium]|nr:hypothetical protein [Deltaproteobacteria bacterium]